MSNIWTLFRREMRSYFVSPVAYALLVAFLALSGWYFYNLLTHFLDIVNAATEQAIQLQQPPPVVNVNMGILRPWFGITGQILLFLSPILTMRLLAEERGTGRLDLLLSAPVTDFQLVIGKYLAGAAFCILCLATTLVYPMLLFAYGNPEIGQIVAGYLGLLLLSLALTACGLLISALTGNQVVAAAGSFGLILFLWVLGLISSGEGTRWGVILTYISLPEHFGDFTDGVLESRHLVYFVSLIGLLLFLTLRAVESQRWRR
jgi:ABC-2 type transport system permease protein